MTGSLRCLSILCPRMSTVLAGVRVAFVDGANQGQSATTGADGRYTITGVVNGGYTVS